MQFTDAAIVAGTRRRDDGSLLADARIARTGIQLYAGNEVGMDDMDVVRVYRPGSEVFSEATLKSAAHRPVTNDHPPDFVTVDNWKQHAVGQTGDEITGEGIFIRVPLMVSDGATIAEIESGKRELSAGYSCDLDFTGGTTPTGEAYDAKQTNIRFNHIALVRAGRAGPQVRIGDAAKSWGASPVHPTADEKGGPMADNLRKVLVDGLQVETTDAGASAIDKLTKERTDAQKALSDAAAAHSEAVAKLNADHAAAIAAKDKELGTKDAEIETLKANQLDTAKLDQMVADRAAVVARAKSIAPNLDAAGKTDAEIRRAAVATKLGDAKVKDKSDEYVTALFDHLAVEKSDKSGSDPARDAIRSGTGQVYVGDRAASEKAYDEMNDRLANAWRTGGMQKEAV